MLLGEVNLYQRLQSLLRRCSCYHLCCNCIGFGTRTVSRFGQHGFARREMGVKRTMCEARFFHDVSYACAVIPTSPNSTSRSTHDALVGCFLGSSTDVSG